MKFSAYEIALMATIAYLIMKNYWLQKKIDLIDNSNEDKRANNHDDSHPGRD